MDHAPRVHEDLERCGQWTTAELVRMNRAATSAMLRERLVLSVRIIPAAPEVLNIDAVYPWVVLNVEIAHRRASLRLWRAS
jgi:hypothetical protein